MIDETLVGQKIKAIRLQTDEEMDFEDWDEKATVIELESGVLIYPSRDDEGNSSGTLFMRLGDQGGYLFGGE